MLGNEKKPLSYSTVRLAHFTHSYISCRVVFLGDKKVKEEGLGPGHRNCISVVQFDDNSTHGTEVE
jgi:hypothetical protein